MRTDDRFEAGQAHASASAAQRPTAELLPLIDAIEKKLALARQILMQSDSRCRIPTQRPHHRET
jgi:hypothetical protein